MSRSIAIMLLIAAVVYTTYALPEAEQIIRDCGPNQVFDQCGSQCQPTCENPQPTVCTLACTIGCRCQDGYVKNSAGDCVLQRDC